MVVLVYVISAKCNKILRLLITLIKGEKLVNIYFYKRGIKK